MTSTRPPTPSPNCRSSQTRHGTLLVPTGANHMVTRAITTSISAVIPYIVFLGGKPGLGSLPRAWLGAGWIPERNALPEHAISS